MRVIELIEQLTAQIDRIKEKYCDNCLEYDCDECTIWLDYIVDLDEVMERTARRSDIWQDRAVYAMAKALRGLVLDRLHELNRELLDGKRGGLDG